MDAELNGHDLDAEPAAHPAALLFPGMDAEAYAALKADIAANGQRVAILLDSQGRIVDGRNRWKACRELGVAPLTEVLAEDVDIPKLVTSLNLTRRHLRPDQAAAIALDLIPMYAAAAPKGGRPKNLPPDDGRLTTAKPERAPTSAARAAHDMGVAPRRVERAARVAREAPAGTIEKVKRGEVTLKQAEAALPKKQAGQPVADPMNGRPFQAALARIGFDPLEISLWQVKADAAQMTLRDWCQAMLKAVPMPRPVTADGHSVRGCTGRTLQCLGGRCECECHRAKGARR